jgi:CheY-like chemotaxis protein
MNANPPIETLLVEDNANDTRPTLEAFKEAELASHVSVVRDDKEALAFLRKQEPYACAPRPEFILLGLNIAKKDGREVLREVRNDPASKTIPVIVLTASVASSDVAKGYDLHANCYIQKPADYDDFVELSRRLDSLWFSVAEVPSRTKEATE